MLTISIIPDYVVTFLKNLNYFSELQEVILECNNTDNILHKQFAKLASLGNEKRSMFSVDERHHSLVLKVNFTTTIKSGMSFLFSVHIFYFLFISVLCHVSCKWDNFTSNVTLWTLAACNGLFTPTLLSTCVLFGLFILRR